MLNPQMFKVCSQRVQAMKIEFQSVVTVRLLPTAALPVMLAGELSFSKAARNSAAVWSVEFVCAQP
jgi:hypothetical protein